MNSSSELQQASWLLYGLENGTINTTEAYKTAVELDPLLVYFIFRFLREKYPPSNPQASGVIERLLELTSTYDELVVASKKGENDPIREWFDDAYLLRQYFQKSDEFLTMLVEKIEG